jgi:hypothetical protein
MTLGDGNDIHTLVLLKDRTDFDRLLEQAVRKLDLIRDRATVDLDLHKMCLFLRETGLANLSMGTDNSAIFTDMLEFTTDRLATIFSVLLGVASKQQTLTTS